MDECLARIKQSLDENINQTTRLKQEEIQFYEDQMHLSDTARKLNAAAANEFKNGLERRERELDGERVRLERMRKDAVKEQKEESARRQKEAAAAKAEKARRQEAEKAAAKAAKAEKARRQEAEKAAAKAAKAEKARWQEAEKAAKKARR